MMNRSERHEVWERCWSEPQGLIPNYFSPGEYVKLSMLRRELFEKYLDGITEVSEFGCGLGHNLVPLLDTGRRVRGFDWAESAVRHVRAIGIEAHVFDMLKPNAKVKVSGAVITVHALEQLGRRWERFLLFLLEQTPKICIHIEPIAELYDESPRDQERLAYHRKRGYLVGFLPEIKKMEKHCMAEILEVRKSPFGGKDHDAYSVIVWRPL